MREAIGPDIDLMCDINQLWSVHQAIEVGRRIEEYHLFWLEDPTAHDDYPGLARVADALDTPDRGRRVPLRHRAVPPPAGAPLDRHRDDRPRCASGGITQWLKVAGMAEAFNLPVVSHLIPEIHVHLIAAIPNGLTVEYMPWTFRLFEETPAIEDGQIVVPAEARASASRSTRRRSSATRSGDPSPPVPPAEGRAAIALRRWRTGSTPHAPVLPAPALQQNLHRPRLRRQRRLEVPDRRAEGGGGLAVSGGRGPARPPRGSAVGLSRPVESGAARRRCRGRRTGTARTADG